MLLLALALSAASPQHKPASHLVGVAENAVKTRLNAREVQFRNIAVNASSPSVICGEVNARYDFSMFAGYVPFIFTIDTGKATFNTDVEDFAALWNKVCEPGK